MGFASVGMGIASVGYGLRGERVPGRVISISDTNSNCLGAPERVVWVAVGVCAIGLGLLDLYGHEKRTGAFSVAIVPRETTPP